MSLSPWHSSRQAFQNALTRPKRSSCPFHCNHWRRLVESFSTSVSGDQIRRCWHCRNCLHWSWIVQIGNVLSSRRAKQTIAAIVALGVIQVPLLSFAEAPAPSVQKADQNKKKKKKKSARRAARRPVQETQTATRAPEIPAETAYTPLPPETSPPVVAEAQPVAPVSAPLTPPPVPAPVPAAVARQGGFSWLFPVLGLLGLGGLVGAAGSDSSG